MIAVRYLAADERTPDMGDGPWLIVEPFERDGKFYGTGGSHKSGGEWVGYASLPEDDASLETALAAAKDWAEKYNVPTIFVRTEPEAPHA